MAITTLRSSHSYQFTPEGWYKLATQFPDMFFVAAGMPETVDSHRNCVTGKHFNMPDEARELLTN